MDQRKLGLIIAGIGAVILLAAAVLTATSDGDGEEVAADTTTSVANESPTTTTAPSTTTTAAPSTTTTTTESGSTTSTEAATTTTIPESDLVEAFIMVFAAALEAGDVEFVYSRLHPAIVGGFGEELCRTWVETQIMALGDYQQQGALTGPEPGQLSTPAGTLDFDDVYAATVSFTFSGSSFDGQTANFVVDDGSEGRTVYFTGTCQDVEG